MCKKGEKMEQKVNKNSYRKHHILIIDDNVILLRTVKEMLDDKYTVSIATTAKQAFDSISSRLPDLILLDYEMPYINGEEMLIRFKSRNDTMGVPVIYLTGSADRDVVTKLISLKPAGYMLKPPNKQKLVELIDRILNK